ncbi:MAG: AMIN-like domain-containing (lipo)protein [Acidimicrobiales bacterium]
MRRAALAAALAVALFAGACQSGQDPTVGAGDPDATSPGAFTPPQAPPVSAPAVAERAYLTGVTAQATEGGGTRVVFNFDPVVPGYTIDYVERPVTEDGSGDEVAVDGEALLAVRMENAAAARIDGEAVSRTYTGPGRVAASGTPSAVIEVVDAGDFEGVVTWVLGLRQRADTVSVSRLTGPARLVVDVPGPGAG